MATSQFATHSQPTLSAVWRKPAADLRKAARPPAAKPADGQAPAKFGAQGPDAQSTPSCCMPCSPLPSPAQPGEVCAQPCGTLVFDTDKCCSSVSAVCNISCHVSQLIWP